MNNHTIRKVTPAGVVTTLAGKPGTAGFADGTGSQALFNHPWGIAADGEGNVYVADTYNQRIRRITADGVVTTIAGSGAMGLADGIGTAAKFGYPRGIAVDAHHNLYVTNTVGGSTIRRITPDGVVDTLFPTGSHAIQYFISPLDVVCNADGTLYVSDSGGHVISLITPGPAFGASTIAYVAGLGSTPGNVNGTGSEARFSAPQGLGLTPQGDLLIADSNNHAIRTSGSGPVPEPASSKRRAARH